MTNYTTERTWVDGELVTAGMFNTYIRDNGLYAKEQLDRLSAAIPRNFVNLVLRTHLDADKALTTVQLVRADEIITRDVNGDRYREAPGHYSGITAAITTAGAGGLDTGTEAASTWYQIYYIAGASVSPALILHKSSTGVEDTSFATSNTLAALRDASARTKLGQGFIVSQAGLPHYVRLKLDKTGSPTGEMWATIEGDSAGNPDGNPIATSDKINVAKLSGEQLVIFIFRGNSVLLSAGTQYHVVIQGSYSVSGTDHVRWRSNSSGGYASGQLKSFDGTTTWTGLGSDAVFAVSLKINPTGTPPVTLPTDYTRWCFLGWVYNNSSSDFTPFKQYDRLVNPMVEQKFLSAYTDTQTIPVTINTFVPLADLELTCSGFIYNDGYGFARNLLVSGAPDGYMHIDNALVASRGQSWIRGLDEQDTFRPVLTEAQIVYATVGTYLGGGNLYIEAWEWMGEPPY